MADGASDIVAAEFVLGTLDPVERTAFLRLMARDPATVAAALAWQERLAPLALALPPVAPPETLLPRIEGALGFRPVAANDNRVRWWQAATVAATMVAAVGLGLAYRQERRVVPVAIPVASAPAPAHLTAIAALSEHGSPPMLFVTYDRAMGRIDVVPVAMSGDAAHSLQLWLIQGKAAPRPLGLVDPSRTARLPMSAPIAPGAAFAISREPIGGSPTGLPTGPVLGTGAVVSL